MSSCSHSEECPICLDEINPNMCQNEICITCKKVFCSECIYPTNVACLKKCPHCRAYLEEDTITSIEKCLKIVKENPDFKNIGYIYHLLYIFYTENEQEKESQKYLNLALEKSFPCSFMVKYNYYLEEKLEEEAQKYLDLAVKNNCGTGHYCMAEIYNCKGMISESKRMLVSSSNLGCTMAQYVVGDFYLSGKVLEKDIEKGLELLEKCSAKNYVPAVIDLANIYYYGQEKIEANYNLYLKYTKIAAFNGDEACQFNYGFHLYNNGFFYEAYIWFSKSNQGKLAVFMSGKSLINLGRNIDVAIDMIKDSAKEGLLAAKFEFSIILFEGKYLPQKEEQAFAIMKELAEKKYIPSYGRLAHYYLHSKNKNLRLSQK